MSEHDPAAPSPDFPSERSGGPSPTVIEHSPEPAVAVRRRGGTPLLLTLLLALATGGGLYWVWDNPKVEPQATPAAAPPPADDAARAELVAQLPMLVQQLQTLSGRVDTLEKQPATQAGQPGQAAAGSSGGAAGGDPDLAKRIDDLSTHVDALAAKQAQADAAAPKPADAGQAASGQAASGQSAPPDTAAIAAVVAQQSAALGQKLDASLGALDGRLSKLEQAGTPTDQSKAVADEKTALDAFNQRLAKLEQAGQIPDQSQTIAQQKATIDGLDQRLAKLEQAGQAPDRSQAIAQQKTAIDGLDQRLAKLEQAGQAAQQDRTAQQNQAALTTLDTRVVKLEQGAGDVRGVAKDASRAIRLEAAEAALAAGQPLGDLPGAPPALARFATTAPPTESSLRSAWPQVEAAARAASQPDLSHRSFLDRALARLQQSVTVRQGDQVIVGDPASGILAHARQALDNGDLKGAAESLTALDGPAAAATHDWVAQVHALLEARAALVAMARS